MSVPLQPLIHPPSLTAVHTRTHGRLSGGLPGHVFYAPAGLVWSLLGLTRCPAHRHSLQLLTQGPLRPVAVLQLLHVDPHVSTHAHRLESPSLSEGVRNGAQWEDRTDCTGMARAVYQQGTCLRVIDSFCPLIPLFSLYFIVLPQTTMISPFSYTWFLP